MVSVSLLLVAVVASGELSDSTRAAASARTPVPPRKTAAPAPAPAPTTVRKALAPAPKAALAPKPAPALKAAPAAARATAPTTAVRVTADSIVVDKSNRTMTLYQRGTPVRVYFVALGFNPVGDKSARGDGRTPEGLYTIEGHNPESQYHLSLRISYPDRAHAAQASARGVAPGGDIMIHGLPRGFENVGAEHRQRDWTNGCIAVTNAEIEEIWSAIPDGARILIKP